MAVSTAIRPSLAVTLAVWKALFLREAVDRISRERSAWLWLLLEPVAHIIFLMLVFSTIRVRVISGIDTGLWIMIGLLAFFMFRRPAQQAATALANNQVLFSYRQVKPVDAVLVRAVLEGFLMVMIILILFALTGLYGRIALPADPLAVLGAFAGLWLCGLGFILIVTVVLELSPELGRLAIMTLQPLYLISGVMFPLSLVPHPYREWLMLNPLAHGLEAARQGFVPHYRAVPELSMEYLFGYALVTVFLGLALHLYFAKRLAAQ